MERRYIKDVGAYIDPTIEDVWLRTIDWNIAIYTLTEQWDLVIAHKWRRANYLLGVCQ